MRWLWILLAGYLLLVLEVGLLQHLRGLGTGPDLVLLFVIFLSLYGPVEDAAISGWVLGASKDALSGGTFGLYAVIFMTLAFFLSRIRSEIFLEYNRSHIVNAAIATLLAYGAVLLWHLSGGSPFLPMVGGLVGTCIWNAVLGPVFFHIFLKFSGPLETAKGA